MFPAFPDSSGKLIRAAKPFHAADKTHCEDTFRENTSFTNTSFVVFFALLLVLYHLVGKKAYVRNLLLIAGSYFDALGNRGSSFA